MSVHLNCPFCGKSADIDMIDCAGARPPKFRAQCQQCKAATAWHDREEDAWKAWNTRDVARRIHILPGMSLIINKDTFILNGLLYARNHLTGNCTAQKEYRGKSLRIKEDVFLAAYEELQKIAAGDET